MSEIRLADVPTTLPHTARPSRLACDADDTSDEDRTDAEPMDAVLAHDDEDAAPLTADGRRTRAFRGRRTRG